MVIKGQFGLVKLAFWRRQGFRVLFFMVSKDIFVGLFRRVFFLG
jgi:hypothetical protein